MRLFELSMDDGDRVGPVHQAVLATNPLDCSLTDVDSGGRRLMRMVFSEGDGQKALDTISTMLEHQEGWRLVVLPVEASLPKLEAEPDPEAKKKIRTVALREEIYQDIQAGTKLDRDFLILTMLSTIVVVFGLAADNVAAVIGAMVIAPLLGPILAFALGSALGDFELMSKATRTALSGLFLGMAISVVIGLVFDVNLGSAELTNRTIINAAVWAVLIVALTAVAVYLTVPGVPEVPGVPRP